MNLYIYFIFKDSYSDLHILLYCLQYEDRFSVPKRDNF